jgi:hypothetical protein
MEKRMTQEEIANYRLYQRQNKGDLDLSKTEQCLFLDEIEKLQAEVTKYKTALENLVNKATTVLKGR